MVNRLPDFLNSLACHSSKGTINKSKTTNNIAIVKRAVAIFRFICMHYYTLPGRIVKEEYCVKFEELWHQMMIKTAWETVPCDKEISALIPLIEEEDLQSLIEMAANDLDFEKIKDEPDDVAAECCVLSELLQKIFYKIGPKIQNRLLKELKRAKNINAQCIFIEALGKIRSRESFDITFAVLKGCPFLKKSEWVDDEHWDGSKEGLRMSCIKALGDLGDKRAFEYLSDFLILSEDVLNHEHIIGLAAIAIAKIDGKRAIPLLAKVLRENKYWFSRCRVVEALAETKNRAAIKHIRSALKDENFNVANEAMKALKRFSFFDRLVSELIGA